MKSLRSQLTGALGFSICGLLVMGGLGIFFVTRGVLEDQFDNTLAAKASALQSLDLTGQPEVIMPIGSSLNA